MHEHLHDADDADEREHDVVAVAHLKAGLFVDELVDCDDIHSCFRLSHTPQATQSFFPIAAVQSEAKRFSIQILLKNSARLHLNLKMIILFVLV